MNQHSRKRPRKLLDQVRDAIRRKHYPSRKVCLRSPPTGRLSPDMAANLFAHGRMTTGVPMSAHW